MIKKTNKKKQLTTTSPVYTEDFWVPRRISSLPYLEVYCPTGPALLRCSALTQIVTQALHSSRKWGRSNSGWNGAKMALQHIQFTSERSRIRFWKWLTWGFSDGCTDSSVQRKFLWPPGLRGCSCWGPALLAPLPPSQSFSSTHCRAAILNPGP